jgi:hypothetical protein
MKYIEICVALILVFALLSIVVSMLAERWNSVRKVRSEMLKKSIMQMLNDPLNLNYGFQLINHPLIASMKDPEGRRSFQYLEPSLFADALMDVIAGQADKGLPVGAAPPAEPDLFPEPLEAFKKGVEAMNDSPMKELFASMAAKAEGKHPLLKAAIENWYRCNTARMTGWYKRKQQKPLFFIALAVALVLNVDAIHLFRTIAIDDGLRKDMVETAEQVVVLHQDSAQMVPVVTNNTITITATTTTNDSAPKDSVTLLKLRGIPIGWSRTTAPLSWIIKPDKKIDYDLERPLDQYHQKRNEGSFWNIISWLLGILITALMTCFGAPFWFDILSKFVNIRRSGTRPEDQPKSPTT